MPQFSTQTLQAVARVSRCSSAVVHEEMKQGLYGLATIACLAPWIGLFGTIVGIVDSFTGFHGQSRRAILWNISQSMWPTAFGLAVGIVALWCYRYLEGRLQILDHEMEGASLELLNQLSRFRGRFSAEPSAKALSDGPMFGERPLAELSRDEKLRESVQISGGNGACNGVARTDAAAVPRRRSSMRIRCSHVRHLMHTGLPRMGEASRPQVRRVSSVGLRILFVLDSCGTRLRC